MAVEVLICLKTDGEGRVNKGWSEKHIYIPDVLNLRALQPQMTALANARLGCAAANVWLSEMRASRPGVFRDSFRLFSRKGGDRDSGIEGPGALKDYRADQTNACLNVLLQANDVQKKTMYLAGVPDDLIVTAPSGPDYAAVPEFVDAWNLYRNLLTNGSWGFKARSLNREANLVDVVDWNLEPNAPFSLVASIDALNDFGAVGDQVQIRGVSALTRGTRLPNGIWKIKAKSGAGGLVNFTLRSAIGYDPTNFDDAGTIEPVLFQYATYLVGKIIGQGTRKRGVGPIRPRGRASVRRK